MPDPIATLTASFQPTGDIAHDAPAFLALHGMDKAGHSAAVAAEARRLALRFGADPAQAEAAGWLHDISGVWPTPERARIARALGVEVLPEEDAFPLILHQKLSVVVAQRVFGVADEAVLSAIGCHTTLRRGATLLDKVVFLADKIAWDQAGAPPYGDAVLAALELSLDAAVFAFLDWQWQRREQLGVVHPWLVAAREELAAGCE
jgi:predicted HD superfamily hydrolase involved in NAD metabolism